MQTTLQVLISTQLQAN